MSRISASEIDVALWKSPIFGNNPKFENNGTWIRLALICDRFQHDITIKRIIRSALKRYVSLCMVREWEISFKIHIEKLKILSYSLFLSQQLRKHGSCFWVVPCLPLTKFTPVFPRLSPRWVKLSTLGWSFPLWLSELHSLFLVSNIIILLIVPGPVLRCH